MERARPQTGPGTRRRQISRDLCLRNALGRSAGDRSVRRPGERVNRLLQARNAFPADRPPAGDPPTHSGSGTSPFWGSTPLLYRPGAAAEARILTAQGAHGDVLGADAILGLSLHGLDDELHAFSLIARRRSGARPRSGPERVTTTAAGRYDCDRSGESGRRKCTATRSAGQSEDSPGARFPEGGPRVGLERRFTVPLSLRNDQDYVP